LGEKIEKERKGRNEGPVKMLEKLKVKSKVLSLLQYAISQRTKGLGLTPKNQGTEVSARFVGTHFEASGNWGGKKKSRL